MLKCLCRHLKIASKGQNPWKCNLVVIDILGTGGASINSSGGKLGGWYIILVDFSGPTKLKSHPIYWYQQHLGVEHITASERSYQSAGSDKSTVYTTSFSTLQFFGACQEPAALTKNPRPSDSLQQFGDLVLTRFISSAWMVDGSTDFGWAL